VHPAKQLSEHEKPVVLVSALTGLPNRQAFERGNAKPFVAAIGISLIRIFSESYGPMVTDTLIRRLAKTLVNAGLEAYHQQADEFLCRGDSAQELSERLALARRIFREPFEIYADGRIQMVEEFDFSFGIGTCAEEAEAALHQARAASAGNEAPEWLRKILGTGGSGRGW
jgi:GGDEF domain-containing protein